MVFLMKERRPLKYPFEKKGQCCEKFPHMIPDSHNPNGDSCFLSLLILMLILLLLACYSQSSAVVMLIK